MPAEALKLSSRYDEVSEKYGKLPFVDRERELYWLAYDRLTWAAVERLLPKDGRVWRVLDAGGGAGKFGTLFAERGHSVTVLDLSAGMLESARTAFREKGLLERAHFVEGNVMALPFAEALFDLVFCEGDPVSYCLDGHPQAVRELVRVAKPGAPVVMGLDNRQEYFKGTLKYGKPEEALDILLTGRAVCPYGLPVHTFTLPELHAAVDEAGARVEEIFGKPVLFWEVLEALKAKRGPGFDAWEAREEVLALQERLAHEGYAASGGHFQVMARRRP
jgi:ubiquinone/menaquinone biosynthesis C-methylase UbiE